MEDFFYIQKQASLNKAEKEEVDLAKHNIEEDDVRFILVAERVEILSQLWRDNRAKPGMEHLKQSYDRFGPLRLLTMILIIIQIFVSRPQWCKTKGDNIDVNFFEEMLLIFLE